MEGGGGGYTTRQECDLEVIPVEIWDSEKEWERKEGGGGQESEQSP